MNRSEFLRMSGLPGYQNKMYPSAQHALACPRGDLVLIQDAITGGLALDVAIDINPARQSGYLAGTGLAVLALEQGAARLADGDQVFVMNSNDQGEITRAGGERRHYISVESP